MTRTAVIMGQNGKFGGAVARALATAGWTLRAFRRGQDDLTQMALGADVIVMGAHPPSYDLWSAQMPGLHHRVQQAALASGVLVLFPGNVYVYGMGAGPVLGPDTPHAATNPLGRLRVDVETAYARAGVRTLILRAGDFIDAAPSGNWFDRFMTPRLAKGIFRYPGRTDVPHAWAFLPDLGRAAAALLDDPARYHGVTEVLFPGYTLTGADMAAILSRCVGRDVAPRPFPWWQVRMLRPFMPALGGVLEMRYLWDMPHRLDQSGFRALVPDFVETPVQTALHQATAHLQPTQNPMSIQIKA